MPKFIVHAYCVVRVPIEVEADSAVQAAKKADAEADYQETLNNGKGEFAEEVLDFTVDELGENGEVLIGKTLDLDEFFNVAKPRFYEDDDIDDDDGDDDFFDDEYEDDEDDEEFDDDREFDDEEHF